ncbi:MAG TPA: sigma-54 dependent transcriptional regulator [bacterium]|nr:sigma-54 dependent transcriptional regulator [bacterium]HPN31162.1 sigma-54 dependent transcriptional regulator [bacterium]
MITILIVDDNKSICEILTETFTEKGYKTESAESGERAVELLKSRNFDIIITDLKMRGISGLDILKYVKLNYPDIEVMIITAFGTIDAAVEAMRCGAYDFILKPFKIDEIEKKIDNIVKQIKLTLNNEYLSKEIENIFDYKQMIGHSKGINKVLSDIEKVAVVNSTVLIYGETGTGKELAARYIHNRSPRKNNSFIKLNCGALPSELLESELFGHVKGAFTSAYKDRTGRFELADKGTLFIDEISEIPLMTQMKLLRVLQEREFERVGSSETIKTDARIIAATNRNLEEMVAQNLFRQDLFYRLNVFPITIPPLRERKDDIPELINYFIKKYVNLTGKKIKKIDNQVVEILTDYDWPGNIRELENIIERMIVVCGNDSVIDVKSTPVEIKKKSFSVSINSDNLDAPLSLKSLKLPELVSDLETRIIREQLKKNNNNQSKTAETIGISRTDLQYKIKKYGLNLNSKNKKQ